MKICILMGSPRKKGNTIKLLTPFMEELELNNIPYDIIWLYDKRIEPCIACRKCQKDWSVFGCHYQDDAQEIFDKIYACDVIVLATPIYSWFCTPPMKALLDRLVYGMNKYYGDEKGPSLWAGKKLAIIATCGYRPEKGADLFEEAMKRYCKHSQLTYAGMLAERDLGYKSIFVPNEEAAKNFARQLIHHQGILLREGRLYMSDILQKLLGGDLRSIGRVDEVVADVLADNALFPQLLDGMVSSDPVVRMRSADAVEKLTRDNPTWLIPFKKRLIEEISQIEQQEVQWHLAQMFPRLDWDKAELEAIVSLLRKWSERSKSKIVKVNSLQALCDLALRYPELKPSVVAMLQESIAMGSPAVVSRGKKLLKALGVHGGSNVK